MSAALGIRNVGKLCPEGAREILVETTRACETDPSNFLCPYRARSIHANKPRAALA